MQVDILEIRCGKGVVFIEDVDPTDESFRFMRKIARTERVSAGSDGQHRVMIVLPEELPVRQRFGRLQAVYPLNVAGKRHLKALNTACKETDLPYYVNKALEEGGVKYVHQFITMSEHQLLAIKGIGKTAYQHLMKCIHDMDLLYGMDLSKVQEHLMA